MAQLFNSTKMFSPEEKSLSSSQMRLEMENVDDEDHEDPLVIDEAEEKSDGADSDEKV